MNPHDLYEALSNQWTRAGGSAGWHIGPLAWERVRSYLAPGVRTFETGSGLSTWLFGVAGCEHTALECSPHWFSVVTSSAFVQDADVLLRELVLDSDGVPWYAWEPDEKLKPFDVVLIDGPQGDIGRSGVLDKLTRLTHGESVVFIDDANREAEQELAVEIGTRLQTPVRYHAAGREAGRMIAQVGGLG